MKKYILLVCISCVLVACEDIQDNSPAFQANLDNDFYRALDAVALQDDDGIVSLIGSTSDESIGLTFSVRQGVDIQLNSGDNDIDQAYFKDASGKIYSTENGGSGVMRVNQRNVTGQIISGTFSFTAISQNFDTIVVNKGLFYQVPYNSGTIDDPEDPENPNQEGGMVAEIDGEVFDPSTVIATTTDTTIQISGALGDNTIQLLIPLDAVPATHAIPENGFNAIYFISGAEEPAVSGNIRVFAHDMTARSISGTFSFVTENHVISLGQYNVDY